jgi:hypothetical protein
MDIYKMCRIFSVSNFKNFVGNLKLSIGQFFPQFLTHKTFFGPGIVDELPIHEIYPSADAMDVGGRCDLQPGLPDPSWYSRPKR